MRRQKMASDSYDSTLGIINGIMISLPLWGILYFSLRLFHLWD